MESKCKLSHLIEALQIFLKYEDRERPTHCEHDVMQVQVEGEISPEDIQRLDELGFNYYEAGDGEDAMWKSFRFGSA